MTPAEIRAHLADLSPRGPGRRYPPELREAAIAHTRTCLRAGQPLTHAATELGIRTETLRRWADDVPSVTALVPVVAAPRRADDLRVRTPSGLVLEGLDLSAAIAVLQALG